MTTHILTQEELKSQLHYDPETGVFTRLVANAGNVKIGDIADCKTYKGYIQIALFSKRYRAHRLAYLYMTGSWPKEQIDHINGIRNDNRWCNLREASQQQNQFNCAKNKNNTSGYKGVFWHKQRNKWFAQTSLNNKLIHLGLFNNKDDAARAYNDFAEQNHGDFFKPNQLKAS